MPSVQSITATVPEFTGSTGRTGTYTSSCPAPPARQTRGEGQAGAWESGSDWPLMAPEIFAYVGTGLRALLVADPTTKNWFKFQALATQWKRDRGSMSSVTQAAMMEPYQKIIGMGEDAVPLILAQLESEGEDPDQWFWALRAITGENPVQPEDQGDFRKMARAWFQWRERREYAW